MKVFYMIGLCITAVIVFVSCNNHGSLIRVKKAV